MADFTFLQGHGEASRDGGGAYVAKLSAALRQAGHGAAVVSGTEVRRGQVTVIDGAALSDFTADAVARAVVLIHHFADLPAGALLPHASRVVATSDAAAMRLTEAFAVPPERITVVTPGVPDAPRSAGSGASRSAGSGASRSAGSGAPSANILSVGALVPRKGHDVLIAALAKLPDLDWRLTIVGPTLRDPATAESLRQAAETLGGRVVFAGPVDDAALDALWQDADLFALATRWEGFPAAVAEALRRGLPVAVTAGGAAAQLVTPQTGVVCEPGDTVQLSKALRRMIFDTGLRTSMADAAWALGQTLPGWTQQAEKFAAAAA